MTANYRGFEISVRRERALGGWDQIQYQVTRLSDGWFCQDDFHYGEYGSVRQVMAECKAAVDRLRDHMGEMDDEEVPPDERERRAEAFWAEVEEEEND